MAKVISWNVNGIRAAHKKGLLDFVDQQAPDVLCLQETKAHPEQLPGELKELSGYHCHYASAEKRGYSGVSIWSKTAPLSVETMGIQRFDCEGRVLIAEFPSSDTAPAITVINAYFPNSQEAGKRLDYKLDFCEEMQKLCLEFDQANRNVLLCGDYNVAHTPIDLANPETNTKNPGYLPEERAWMNRFIGTGFIDTFRMFTKEGGHYSWWSYRAAARQRNIGWRIDYHCVNPALEKHVKSSVIMPEITGSDHCPVTIHFQQNK